MFTRSCACACSDLTFSRLAAFSDRQSNDETYCLLYDQLYHVTNQPYPVSVVSVEAAKTDVQVRRLTAASFSSRNAERECLIRRDSEVSFDLKLEGNRRSLERMSISMTSLHNTRATVVKQITQRVTQRHRRSHYQKKSQTYVQSSSQRPQLLLSDLPRT